MMEPRSAGAKGEPLPSLQEALAHVAWAQSWGGQRKDPVRTRSCKPDAQAVSGASPATVSDPSLEPTEHWAVVPVTVTGAPKVLGWWL